MCNQSRSPEECLPLQSEDRPEGFSAREIESLSGRRRYLEQGPNYPCQMQHTQTSMNLNIRCNKGMKGSLQLSQIRNEFLGIKGRLVL